MLLSNFCCTTLHNFTLDEAPIPQCEQKRKMVRLLVDEGIVEKLAKAAVQHCGLPLDRDECFIKALELEPNEYDADDEINDLVREFDKEAGELLVLNILFPSSLPLIFLPSIPQLFQCSAICGEPIIVYVLILMLAND